MTSRIRNIFLVQKIGLIPKKYANTYFYGVDFEFYSFKLLKWIFLNLKIILKFKKSILYKIF